MNHEQKMAAIRDYVYELFHDDVTGHDYYHMERVARVAIRIAKDEGANEFICEAAAWVHDVGDNKLFADPNIAWEDLSVFFSAIDITEKQIIQITDVVKTVSFSKGVKIPGTLEAKIVQDADRIDAIGAIGIARTFAYGGANNQLIHHDNKQNTSIAHFYDKLLKLKDLMHTDTAKELAGERHLFMEKFLDQFSLEW